MHVHAHTHRHRHAHAHFKTSVMLKLDMCFRTCKFSDEIINCLSSMKLYLSQHFFGSKVEYKNVVVKVTNQVAFFPCKRHLGFFLEILFYNLKTAFLN